MHTVLRTDTTRIPVIDGDTTVEIRPPWMRPPITATYRRPSPTLAARWQRFASDYVGHVRSGWQRALAVLGVLGVAYFGLFIARGAWVAAELLAAMTRDDQIRAVCLAITAVSALALLLLRNPRSFLSRLVDRPDETNREVTR